MLLIPLYNIYLGLTLMFQKGTEGENAFGTDPLGREVPDQLYGRETAEYPADELAA